MIKYKVEILACVIVVLAFILSFLCTPFLRTLDECARINRENEARREKERLSALDNKRVVDIQRTSGKSHKVILHFEDGTKTEFHTRY